MQTVYGDTWSDNSQSYDIELCVRRWRSSWPIFHGAVILPYILKKTVWWMNIIFFDNESVQPLTSTFVNLWHQNKCMSQWPIFYSPVILPYVLKTNWWMSVILSDNVTVWPSLWPKINIGRHDLYFMIQWFWLISWRLFDGWTSNFLIMSLCDTTFDIKINVGHRDLYFTVQWHCLISWKLFDIWM